MATAPIPRVPLTLGLLGVIPFVWGALTLYSDALASFGNNWFGPRFVGPYIQLAYGSFALCFLSGALFGFATRADPAMAASAYGLSILPMLWTFAFVGNGPTSSSVYLLAGLTAVLGLDWLYWKNNLTPHWWFRLRLMLTLFVGAALLATLVALGG